MVHIPAGIRKPVRKWPSSQKNCRFSNAEKSWRRGWI